MRINLRKAGLAWLVVGSAVMLGIIPTASADNSPDDGTPFAPNGEREVIENVGSDTTYFVVCDMAQRFQQNKPGQPAPGVNPTPGKDYAKCTTTPDTSTVPPEGAASCTFVGRSTPPYIVPGDVDDDPAGHTYCENDTAGTPIVCTGGAYVTGGDYEPPNGSSEGIQAVADCAEGPPLDFARSSRRINTADADEQDMQFFAFALDAVTWTRWQAVCPGGDTNPRGCSPNNLTKQQLRDIYSCAVTDWSAVGGDSEPIIRYSIQAGSGSRSFFENRVLGGGISMTDGIAGSCPAAPELQEHDATGVVQATKPAAIYAYSVSRWNTQASGYETDKRNQSRLASINGVLPSSSTITESGALPADTTACDPGIVPPNVFCATRYVWNVIDTPADTNPGVNDAPDWYEATKNFVGVRLEPGADNDHNGAVCSGKYVTQITTAGFEPLPMLEDLTFQIRLDDPSACRLESVITNANIEAVDD